MNMLKKQWKLWMLTLVMLVFTSGVVLAAPKSDIGIIDTQQVLQAHPDMEGARQKMQLEEQRAQQDFETNAKDLANEAKEQYIQNLQQKLAKLQQEMMEPIGKKIDAAIKKVAESKGLSVVLDRSGVVRGGTDITQDVIKEIVK
ncbi:MAG TPA: OmpH family outer membrane protein [Candidatus Avacidaminococcus intestinavium]|uniref:OmpH family outer membrane protein n=1 Tax=Candidatus Avacidaminococcus intestinavium TaxID=2840684 RepID=A0A9D1SL08_9FIRM|nr:OmpH family outer membrane protein [Candidatus Avacidaminococcus intestinavium]